MSLREQNIKNKKNVENLDFLEIEVMRSQRGLEPNASMQ